MDEALLECYQSLRMSGEQRSSWSESFILFLPAQFAPKAPKLLKWEISCILGYFFLELQFGTSKSVWKVGWGEVDFVLSALYGYRHRKVCWRWFTDDLQAYNAQQPPQKNSAARLTRLVVGPHIWRRYNMWLVTVLFYLSVITHSYYTLSSSNGFAFRCLCATVPLHTERFRCSHLVTVSPFCKPFWEQMNNIYTGREHLSCQLSNIRVSSTRARLAVGQWTGTMATSVPSSACILLDAAS